jgi:hypothetical protein
LVNKTEGFVGWAGVFLPAHAVSCNPFPALNHDKLIKQVLGEPENAASFLAANLPAELVRHLDLDSLTVVQTSFIDAQFAQSEADLLFSVTVANRPGYVYLLIEHQSSPDGFMMLRLLHGAGMETVSKRDTWLPAVAGCHSHGGVSWFQGMARACEF